MSRGFVRVAVEGCGHGTLNAIYASIDKACEVREWDGVDLLIIGGDFQAVRNSYDLNAMSVPMKFREIGDFHEYYSGKRTAPYLTIFVGGNHEASNHLFELFYGGWVAPNIYYLGAANVIRFGPLRIAGLSGIWKGYSYKKPHFERPPYNESDVKSAYHVREFDVQKLLQIRTQIDIGISHDWPRGIEWFGNWKALFAIKNHLETDARDGILGSPAAKYVMDRLRPRYWFAAHLHCKFSATVNHKLEGSLVERQTEPNRQIQVPKLELLAATNADEIDIDIDDADEVDDGNAESRTAATPGIPEPLNEAQEETIQHVLTSPLESSYQETVPEDVRALLPASFARPQPISTKEEPPMITNTVTQFLALDKCLGHRKFLQLLEIEAEEAQSSLPYRLSYDKEWLAITRAYAANLVIGNKDSYVKGHQPIVEAEEWVWENIVAKGLMGIPEDFQLTAPVYDPSIGIATKEQPREYTNPQTVRFCTMLGIPNPFDISEEERDQRMRHVAESTWHGHNTRGGHGRGGRGRGQGHYRGRGRPGRS